MDVDITLSFTACVFGVAYHAAENRLLLFLGPLLVTIERRP